MAYAASAKVLVLNRSWIPVDVTTVPRAIMKLFKVHEHGSYKGQPKARIIDPAMDFQTFSWADWEKIKPQPGDDVIRGIGREFRLFDVIMLTEYDKQPSQRLHFSRSTIWRRDAMKCQYCGCKISTKATYEGTIDHIIPKSKGGLTTWENCVLACIVCNSQKADRTPEDAIKPKKQLPDRPVWRGPSPMKLRSVPVKPKMTLLRGDRKHMRPNWKSFISEAYWETQLQNDMTSDIDSDD